MEVAIPIFDRFTALDAVGPYEVLSRLPEATVRFAAVEPGPKRADTGMLVLVAEHALADLPGPQVVVVPGGPGYRRAMKDEPLLEWLRRAHETSMWTASVCTGAHILGAAGILAGRRAATHWLALEELAACGATPDPARVVVDGKVVTGAGVSAGIDLALRLASLIAGADAAQMAQLLIQYAPEPPFAAGSPETAPAHLVERLRELSRAARARHGE